MKAIATIYSASFDELDATQKAQAIDVMRNIESQDATPYWGKEMTEQLKETLWNEYGVYNADIQWQGFCSQGDGASISTDYNIMIETFLRKCKVWSKFRSLHNHIKNDEIVMKVERTGHMYSHSNMVRGSVSFHWGVDYTPTQEAASEELEQYLTDKIRELSDKLYSDLSDENDYHNSDEALTDLINANDYHFEVLDGEVQGLARN